MGKGIKAIWVDVDKLIKAKARAHKLIRMIQPGDSFFILTCTKDGFESMGMATPEDLEAMCLGFNDRVIREMKSR